MKLIVFKICVSPLNLIIMVCMWVMLFFAAVAGGNSMAIDFIGKKCFKLSNWKGRWHE